MLFNKIEDAYVILTKKGGVWQQSDVYQRNGYLYSRYGSGFIRLTSAGTSNPDTLWEEIDLPFDYTLDSMGRLRNPEALKSEGRKPRRRLKEEPNATWDKLK